MSTSLDYHSSVEMSISKVRCKGAVAVYSKRNIVTSVVVFDSHSRCSSEISEDSFSCDKVSFGWLS